MLSVYFVFQLQFSFSFEQFFPDRDPDLLFFRQFTEEFETDDNFQMMAIERSEGVFDSVFLAKVYDLTLKARQVPHVTFSQSLLTVEYPRKTPFSILTVPAVRRDQPDRYSRDRARVLEDERFAGTLINEDATALIVFLKLTDNLQYEGSKETLEALIPLIDSYDFEEVYYLGRATFQRELIELQKREIIFSAAVSFVLVTLVLLLIFRRAAGVMIALVSVALGMLLFLGFMGAFGRELSAMAALYPVLMIIVGTSDVIHIMSKYVDELQKGFTRREALITTVKQIGLATLLTSVTTAIGFLSLLSSRVPPIREFGLNAAVGVIIAYGTVLLFTTALLSLFRAEQIIKFGKGHAFWQNSMLASYNFTRRYGRHILAGSVLLIGLCAIGISLITTNYRIEDNLPRNSILLRDYRYFQDEFTGFRPLEFAILAQGDYYADDYEVLSEVNELEQYLATRPEVKGVQSVTAIYKSIARMYGANRVENYRFPEDRETFERYDRLAERIPDSQANVLLSRDRKKARVSSRILDIGSDTVRLVSRQIDEWIEANIDSSIVEVRRTGTGLMFDKNEEYIRDSLLYGLGLAVLVVSVLMALLFRNIKVVIISLIPNILPLLIAAGLLGYAGIELEAGVSIMFAIVFGIAVDDTIHFLSKYKLSRDKGLDIEESLRITFLETGKAIVLTSIILFFGFLIMLFSEQTATFRIGIMISVTLFSAVVCDLALIPVLVRLFFGRSLAGIDKK